jgi:hypothetical protein
VPVAAVFLSEPGAVSPVRSSLLAPCLPLWPVYSGKERQVRTGPDDSNCKNQGDRFLGRINNPRSGRRRKLGKSLDEHSSPSDTGSKRRPTLSCRPFIPMRPFHTCGVPEAQGSRDPSLQNSPAWSKRQTIDKGCMRA